MYYQGPKMKELDDDSVSNLPGNPENRSIIYLSGKTTVVTTES